MPIRITHPRQTYSCRSGGTAKDHMSEPVHLALGATLLEIFLRIHAKSSYGQAKVLYEPSANGAYYAASSEVIANQTAVGTYQGSKTSGLGAAGRVILEVSASSGTDEEYVEAEVITVWKD